MNQNEYHDSAVPLTSNEQEAEEKPEIANMNHTDYVTLLEELEYR